VAEEEVDEEMVDALDADGDVGLAVYLVCMVGDD